MRLGLRRRIVVDSPPDAAISIELGVRTVGGLGIGDVYAPKVDAGKPAIVMLHGCSGMRADFTQFAFALAGAGARVWNAGWRGVRTGDALHASVADIRDAVASARMRWRRPVTIAAWSDGALPAAIVALGERGPVGFAGLGGFYGWPGPAVPPVVVNERTERYLGSRPTGSPGAWSEANPFAHIGHKDDLQAALFASERDPGLSNAITFRRALSLAGCDVSLRVLPECDPHDLVIPRHPTGVEVVRQLVAFASRVRIG